MSRRLKTAAKRGTVATRRTQARVVVGFGLAIGAGFETVHERIIESVGPNRRFMPVSVIGMMSG